jgi:NADPH:quinone reductase-like Zn-dependent oxidoreductase
LVYTNIGGPENLQFEDNAPNPTLSADHVLVAAAATSVNPIDWKIRSGARQKDLSLTLPAILGHDCEWSGTSGGQQHSHLQTG